MVNCTGVTEKALPLQLVAAMAVIAGTGLTVTITVNVGPVQLPAVGVTV